MRFVKPCYGPITSLYDMKRLNPYSKKVQPHWGVDYGSSPDNSIVAAAHGVVRFIGRGHKTAGNYIVITHPNGWETAYLHLASISVKADQSIVQGQKIGIKGMSGGATGVHLHFEISKGRWSGGSSLNVDPVLYIDDPEVRLLQRNLNALGYSLIEDGIYGDATIKAVADFQRENKLTADGIAGPATVPAVTAAAVAKKTQVASTQQPTPAKEDDDLKFTSGTLKQEFETFLGSKAQREIAVREAVKQGYNAKWIKDLEEGKAANGDVAALAVGALIRANK